MVKQKQKITIQKRTVHTISKILLHFPRDQTLTNETKNYDTWIERRNGPLGRQTSDNNNSNNNSNTEVIN